MTTTRLHMMHASMQFSDTAMQKSRDVVDLFKRADARKVSWITGTEAGEAELHNILVSTAKTHGFRFHGWRSNWIAVRGSEVTAGTWDKGSVFVADTKEVVGPGHDSGFPWVTFVHAKAGPVAVAAGHYPTRGQTRSDPNYDITVRYARKVGEWAKKYGAGARVVFYAGDQNIPDRQFDTFRGQPLTSAWDELHRYEDTGHGNIDVIASYDGDGNTTKAVYIRALDDKEFPQFSDHFVIEAGFDVTR